MSSCTRARFFERVVIVLGGEIVPAAAAVQQPEKTPCDNAMKREGVAACLAHDARQGLCVSRVERLIVVCRVSFEPRVAQACVEMIRAWVSCHVLEGPRPRVVVRVVEEESPCECVANRRKCGAERALIPSVVGVRHFERRERIVVGEARLCVGIQRARTEVPD